MNLPLPMNGQIAQFYAGRGTRHPGMGRLRGLRGLGDSAGIASGVTAQSTDSNGYTTTVYGNGDVVVVDSNGNVVSDSGSPVSATSISQITGGISSAVTGVLQAENAQNMITQENTAANSLISMLPWIVGGIGAYLLLGKAK